MQENQQFVGDGFSSEEELIQQQIVLCEKKKQTPDVPHKEQVKFKIPPPQQIKKKSYSLTPDIATGWAPKSDLQVPIPLLFENRKVDYLIKKILEKPIKNIKLCYLGPRFENTYIAWYEKQFTFPYQHIKPVQNMKFTNRAFFGQSENAYECLMFDSFFQSGNLDCAFQVDERQYDLFLRVDSNTKGHIQWYNFKVKNLQKLQKYKINICNFQKCHSLYTRGMKPYIYSLKKAQKQKIGWHQAGDFVRYERKISKVAKALNLQNSYSYKFSFQYYSEYENDEIQIAYCVPYTYTKLKDLMKELSQKNKQYIKLNKLCTSLGGLDVPLIVIHEQTPSNFSLPTKKNGYTPLPVSKKCVMISGRAHPGQSNGSYMMQGFIKYLCGPSKDAQQLRKNVIFKIVPMLNPDGVALGNYRTGISGKDFNRQYRDPDKEIFPQVHSFKKLVAENKALFGDHLLMFLDFHGHSIKKNVFMYGPQFPITDKNYYESRVFPKMLSNSSQMFRYYSCIFKICPYKVTTARAIILRKLMIPCSYTIEASNGSYYDRQILKDIPFNTNSWIQMGEKIVQSLNQYTQLLISSEKIRLQRIQQKKSRNGPKSWNKREHLSLKNDEQRFKKLFDEIKKMQEEKQFQKNSDDELSEGSSDGQDQKQDLPSPKMKQLVQIIKNKKKSKANEKQQFLNENENSQHFRTQNIDEMTIQLEKNNSNLALDLKKLKNQKDDGQNEIFGKKNMKYQLSKGKNQSSSFRSEKGQQKIPAKIINFSFVGGVKPRINKPPKQFLNNSVLNKKIFFQLYRDKNEEEKQFPEIRQAQRPGKMLDLSDNTFRKTFGFSEKKKKESISKDSREISSPRKVAQRFEQLKYKRLILDQYEV